MDLINLKQSSKWLYLVSVFLILGVILCVLTPNFFFFKWWSKYAMQITIAYWFIGLGFLIYRNIQVTLTAFICCSFLCLYLRNTTNPDLVPPVKTNEPFISIAHFNLTSATGTHEQTLSIIKNIDADVISLQEVTRDWNAVLKDSLACQYPFSCEVATLDFHSAKLYSKYNFVSCDTFYSQGVPNLIIGFPNQYNEGHLYVISSYVEPPLFETAYFKLKSQLDTIASFVNQLKSPIITVGDYNIHSFAYEIQQFRHKAKLNDSRRGYRPYRNDGRIALLEVPIDHIFYSSHFTCIEFQTISGAQSERLGIKGLYQFNKDSMVVNAKQSLSNSNPFKNFKK